MKIDCDYWQPGPVCTLGLYGGRPSPGTCNVCKKRTGAAPDLSKAIPTPGIPLAGDMVAALTKRLGADRAAKWIAAKLGVECGCPERRAKLNALDAKLRKWMGITTKE